MKVSKRSLCIRLFLEYRHPTDFRAFSIISYSKVTLTFKGVNLAIMELTFRTVEVEGSLTDRGSFYGNIYERLICKIYKSQTNNNV